MKLLKKSKNFADRKIVRVQTLYNLLPKSSSRPKLDGFFLYFELPI